MNRRSLFRLLCRIQALVLSGAVLWAVSVTAGSASLSEAWSALWTTAPLGLLRRQLPLSAQEDGLSPAAVMTLRQSPLLLSAREEVAALRRKALPSVQPQPDAPSLRPLEPSAPETETETERQAGADEPSPGGIDNGVEGRTLIPTDPSAYAVFGRVYISNSTSYTLSPQELEMPFQAALTGQGPQILILHSHGSEGYTPALDTGIVWSGDHRTTDLRCNVVRAGDVMADVFAQAGIAVLHDRTLHDYPEYAGSYDRSLASIDRYLKEYPSIRFILDVHRDAIEDSAGRQIKTVSHIQGQGTAAQLSIVVGSDGGGLSHPQWRENLRLAAAIQEQILTAYPTLMRPLLLRNSRYNQHTAPGALLVEVGTAGNAPEEADLAARLFAQEMVEVLNARSK